MTRGTLICVVGPSGAGKDTLLEAMAAARPDIHLVRRVITRAEAAGGEHFTGTTPEGFRAACEAGAFAVRWEAHGLSYGIPADQLAPLAEGRHVAFNGSRGVIADLRARFGPLAVLVVTAPDAVLAARLAARGREAAADIAARLARAGFAVPQGPDVTVIDNGGALGDAVTAALAALPVAGQGDGA